MFDCLTVREHLEMFSGIKNFKNKLDITVDSMITQLDLLDKKDDLAMNLSGG